MPSAVPGVVGASWLHLEQEGADSEEGTELLETTKNAAQPRVNSQLQEAEPTMWGIPMKHLSLVLLTLQTSGQALLLRRSKAQVSGVPYLSSTAVFMTEVLKTFCSLALVVRESGSLGGARCALAHHFTDNTREVLKAAVPSLIYTIQNNLMFYSFEKLSAPVQQVLYQMKILTTAGLGVLMLGKQLKATQWAACFMLATGVALVQWPRHEAGVSLHVAPGWSGDKVKGFLAVLLACCTSGFAAVYTQKMLQQTTASVWIRNVQLGLFGSVMGLAVAFTSDGPKIRQDGFFQGYSGRVTSVIAMNALGGLLCAVMLKYAGATLGCFSTALSIVLTATLSWSMTQDFTPDALFALGTFLAMAASLVYALGLPEPVAGLCASWGAAQETKAEE